MDFFFLNPSCSFLIVIVIFLRANFFQTCVSDWRINILQASSLITDICRNLRTAANSVENTEYTVVLRGDSTLRGHFPEARIVITNMTI